MIYEISLSGGTRTILTCQQTDEHPELEIYVKEDLTGKTLQLEAATKDGSVVVSNCTLASNGHTVRFTLDRNITAVAGTYETNIVTYTAGMKNRRLYPVILIRVDKAAKGTGEGEEIVSPVWVQEIDDIARLAKARADVLTALPAGSTAGNAELADIRVNSAGDTATGAGVAVREGDALNATGISTAIDFAAAKKAELTWQVYSQSGAGTPKNRIFSKSSFCSAGATIVAKDLGKKYVWWCHYAEQNNRPVLFNQNMTITDPLSEARVYQGNSTSEIQGDGYIRLENKCFFEITVRRAGSTTLTDADVEKIKSSITAYAVPGKTDLMLKDPSFTSVSSDDLEYVKYTDSAGRPRIRYQAIFVPEGSVIELGRHKLEPGFQVSFDEVTASAGADSLAKSDLNWPTLAATGWGRHIWYEIRNACFLIVNLKNEEDQSLDTYTVPDGFFTIFYDKSKSIKTLSKLYNPYLTERGSFSFPLAYNASEHDFLWYFRFNADNTSLFFPAINSIANMGKPNSLNNEKLAALPGIQIKDFDGTRYFAIDTNKYLWYDVISGEFGISNLTRIESRDRKISLLEARFGQISGGCFCEKFHRDFTAQQNAELGSSSGFVSSEYRNEPGIAAALEKLNSAYTGVMTGEAYLFFTDPHVFDHVVNESEMEKAIGTIEQAFNRSPAEFVLCGGDWLMCLDTQSQGVEKLARINAIMRAKFGENYYPILGNHDTNYQGVNAAGEANTGVLPQPVIDRLFFSKYGKAYYDFVTNGGTRFYVFDSGIDWTSGSMNAYQWTQAQSFAQGLLDNDNPHSVIAVHMIANQGKDAAESSFVAQAFSDRLLAIAQAYNARVSIEVNGQTFNFASSTGKVAYAICGHTHYDLTTVYKDIPILITRNATYAPHFDYVLVDYAAGKLKTYRVGDGEDREIDIIV